MNAPNISLAYKPFEWAPDLGTFLVLALSVLLLIKGISYLNMELRLARVLAFMAVVAHGCAVGLAWSVSI